MFKVAFLHTLTLPQIDRIRWHLFPEIRVTQGSLLPEQAEAEPAPDLVRVIMRFITPHPDPLPQGEREKTQAPRDPRGGGLGQDDDPGLPGGLAGAGARAADPGAVLQCRARHQAAPGHRRPGIEREGEAARRKFSFASVGIQARGRTTILRLNYRNTAEVLAVAYEFARDILKPEEAEEDGIPMVAPETAGRGASSWTG
jgi:hypothetical protein